MRKLLIIFGALAMISLSLAGCGKSESSASSDGLSSLNVKLSCGGSPCL